MKLRGKFVSVTFAGQCDSASVRKNGGFVDELVDLPVGGFDLALETPEKVRVPFSLLIKDCEIYFTCEGDEKLLPEVLKWVGDDKMMISGDMPHAEARDNSITEIKEREDISEAQKKKILGENAKRFFGL